MGLFSFLSKNKQDGAGGEGEFYSRAEGEAKPRTRKRKQGKVAAQTADNDEPLDPVLPEKKRARRRLVGAVALVLAMIIGLPMLLDSEPKPVADDIAIQIPSRDKPLAPDAAMPPAVQPQVQTQAQPQVPVASTSAGVAASSSAVPASASLGPQEQIVNMPPPEAKPVPPAAEKPAAKPEPKPEKPVEKVADKPADKPQDKTQDKQTVKAEQKHEDKEDARAEAILDGKDAATGAKPAADKKAGKFVVQVAALTSKDKVNELQDKLSDAGFKPMLQTVPTDAGVTTRVRVGPFASKEEAETARAKLAKIGLNGKLLPL